VEEKAETLADLDDPDLLPADLCGVLDIVATLSFAANTVPRHRRHL
jgi:hypothetical protein